MAVANGEVLLARPLVDIGAEQLHGACQRRYNLKLGFGGLGVSVALTRLAHFDFLSDIILYSWPIILFFGGQNRFCQTLVGLVEFCERRLAAPGGRYYSLAPGDEGTGVRVDRG